MTFLLFAGVLGVIPAAIAHQKGRNFLGWWFYGTLLWIVALPHAILLLKDQDQVDARAIKQGGKKCPHCAEIVKSEAKVCRFCGGDLKTSGVREAGEAGVATASAQAAGQSSDKGTVLARIGVLPVLGLSAIIFLYVGWGVSLFMTPAQSPATGAGFDSSERELLEAAQATPPALCSTLGGERAVKFVLCEQGSTEDDWRAGGIAACEKRNACNAWIWEDEQRAAKSIPMTDAQVRAARAVWINAARQLNDCRKDGC